MTQRPHKPTPRLRRRPWVQEATGLGKSQLYALIRQGKMPAPIKLSDRCSAWIEDEIWQWIDTRIAARDEQEAA